jgi:hypothetical protein
VCYAVWAELQTALGRILRGWALAKQAQAKAKAGIVDMPHGLEAYQATGAAVGRPHHLALSVEAYGRMGMIEARLTALTEALILVEKTGERVYQYERFTEGFETADLQEARTLLAGLV